jgi:hypothetical protein
MAVARAEQVICRCGRHSVDQGDDAMHQDPLVGLRLPGRSGAIERAGHGDFGRGELIEALQRSVQLMACCRVGIGRRSSRICVVGAGCRLICIHADRLSDRFMTDSGASGDAAPGSRDRSRHHPGPSGFDPSQREPPAFGWSLPSEGLGRCPWRRASSGFDPKRQTPFRVKEEREDGVAFSAPEKPPDACTPAARREGRVAAQYCATTRRRKR